MKTSLALTAFVGWILGMHFTGTTNSGIVYQSFERPPLQLTLTLLDEEYCTATDDTDTLRAEVLLTFRNISSHDIILFKGSNLVVRTLVSRSLQDVSAGRRELEAVATYLQSGSSTMQPTDQPAGDIFTILPPHGIFETKTSVSFEVSRTEAAPPHAIRPGLHVLQIDVSTWPQAAKNRTQLAALWAHSGTLWYTAIRSEPLLLRVDADRPRQFCSKYARLLEAARRDPNAIEEGTGITALMAAIEQNDLDLFNELISRGANVNAAAQGGITALVLAASREGEYVQRLIQLGTNTNVRSLAGQTPLTVAIRNGRIENVKLLIAAGASVNIPGENGTAPLKLAKEFVGSKVFNQEIAKGIVQILVRAGAKD